MTRPSGALGQLDSHRVALSACGFSDVRRPWEVVWELIASRADGSVSPSYGGEIGCSPKMQDQTESSDTESPDGLLLGGARVWFFCVLFAVLPLVVFLASLELFTSGSLEIAKVFAINEGDDEIFSPFAKGYGSISVFKYSVYVFFHFVVCLFVGFHFLSRTFPIRSRIRVILFGILYSSIVIISVVIVTANDFAFRGYMIEPLLRILKEVAMPLPRLIDAFGINTFLLMALVVPTSMGIIVVVLATCSFHASLFFGFRAGADTGQQTRDSMSTILRHDFIALSAVLVSSVVTARAYFNIPANMFSTDEHFAAVFYRELAQSLSAASGLLFSATLVAAFAPGFVALTTIPDSGSKGEGGFRKILSGFIFRPSAISHRLSGLWQTTLAFIAPAMSAPLLDLLSGFFG